MSEEWCRQQLANLQIKDRRLDTLNEIRNHLQTSSADEVATTSNFLTVSEILACANGDDSDSQSTEQTSLACDILSICMSNIELNASENKYQLEQCLQHPNDDIKYLGLNKLLEISRINLLNYNNLSQMVENSSYESKQINRNTTISVIKCLELESTKFCLTTEEILYNIFSTCDNYLDDNSIRTNLLTLFNHSDITKCRVYDLTSKLAVKSNHLLTKCEFILQHLIVDIDTADILLKLNVLDIMAKLSLSDHGFIYLNNNDIFGKLSNACNELHENPLKNLLIPGYMNFFGTVSTKQPDKILLNFPQMINMLFDLFFDITDYSMLPAAFDNMGKLTSTTQGRILLQQNFMPKFGDTLKEIGRIIHTLNTQLQIRALNFIDTMFDIDNMDNDDDFNTKNRISTILHTWFCSLTDSNNDLKFIMAFCRNPFPEIKCSALIALKSICKHGWGIVALQKTAGFIEFLLDRRVEFNADALHEKFNIISYLSNSDQLDASIIMQMKLYVNKGAFYKETIVEVALEQS